jgi:hypothetical protein
VCAGLSAKGAVSQTLSSMDCPPITTHCGQLWLIWRKMSVAKRPNAPSTHVAPPPLHSSLQSTTPSRGLTPNGFDHLTPPNHSHALAAPHFVPHNTSHGNARFTTKHALTTPFTHMGAPSHTPPSITPTHTNSSRSYKTAVPHRVLLISAPQWK